MAVNKTAGVTKAKLSAAPKKAAVLKKAAPKKAAALKAAPTKPAKPAPASALKKAAPKKAAGPKLTAPQHELLKKVVAHKDAKGYHTDKKPETPGPRDPAQAQGRQEGPEASRDEELPLPGFHHR